MDLSFFNELNLFEASYQFFNQTLAVPTTQAITKQKLSLKDVLRDDVYKSREPFTWVTETYFIGTIDEAAFENGKGKISLNEAKTTKYESILLFSLKIENEKMPTKGQLAELTRALNRSSLDKPVIVLFKYNDFLTYATNERTEYKRKHLQGEKIGKVSLLKDIFIPKPHAGHERILFELTVNPLETTNYTELYEKWQKVFDLQLLNKAFYKELFYWYLWAVRLVKFPKPAEDKNDDHTHSSISVIRLLTRLIFVWFVKEKRLIPEELFNRRKLHQVLKSFIPESEKDSNYYKAILQNLFFATLNTEMNKDNPGSRKFISEDKGPKGQSDDYINHLVYRYSELFENESDALSLFENIPFLNGGLFECLDFFETVNGKNIEKRYDGFSTKKGKQAFVPNIVFFGKDTNIDLSKEFGNDSKFKHEKVRGIIDILSSYKFTIAENTPLEEEIALDPELLGKVFENLLASYNPETQKTARKQTGSFYTPREIVNYMVDESLKAYLIQKFSSKSKQADDSLTDKMDLLFSFGNIDNPFDSDSTLDLIDFISNCRILDPACGSGAFPMGALHRMVHLLGKLDPNNIHWKNSQLQKAKQDLELAKQMKVPEIREKAIESAEMRIDFIKDSFASNHHELDYTRKLFLIENCIYGVDIQQIAVQISKLRFFISLIVDQKVIDSKHNRNILSMPNLETKFVAANSLVPIIRPAGQLNLMGMSEEIKQKELDLREIRQKIFYTRKYKEKKRLKEQEKKQRGELKNVLINSDFAQSTAEQLSGWNPFDCINSANFFDPETMFTIQQQFNIVIGNPPYVVMKRGTYIGFEWDGDLYTMFFEAALKRFLPSNGICSLITPRFFLFNQSNFEMRKYLLNEVNIISFLECSPFDAITENEISTIIKEKPTSDKVDFYIFIKKEITFLNSVKKEWIKANELFEINPYLTEEIFQVLQNIKSSRLLLRSLCHSKRGAEIGKHELKEKKKGRIILLGLDVDRYKITPTEAKIDPTHKEYLRLEDIYNNDNVVLLRRVSKDIIATIPEKPYAFSKNLYGIIPDKKINKYYLSILLNSSLVNFYYKKKFSTKKEDVFPEIQTYLYEQIPIEIPANQDIYSKLYYCISCVVEHNHSSKTFWEKLLNSIIYELYFTPSIKANNCEIIKYIRKCPELGTDLKIDINSISTLYGIFINPNHPISISMKQMQEIEEIKIIEGNVN